MLRGSQGDQQSVGTEFNVLLHQVGVHANELDRKGVADKFLFDFDGVGDNLDNAFGRKLVDELVVEHAGKVAVESLVSADEFVGEGKTGHQTALLEPENGAERSGKEDSLHDAKGDASFGKAGLFGVAPLKSPLGLLLNTWDGVNGVQKTHLFARVLNVGINQQGVSLRVNVFNGNLETVKASGLGGLELRHEILSQVLVDNSVRGGKEGQNVANEMAFVVGKLDPVGHIGTEINLFGGPERGFGLFVHFPQLRREKDNECWDFGEIDSTTTIGFEKSY